MNPVLSRHFSHLWIRDPMTLWKDGIEIDDETQSDHFENIQSTNWQTLRFKPPPPNSSTARGSFPRASLKPRDPARLEKRRPFH